MYKRVNAFEMERRRRQKKKLNRKKFKQKNKFDSHWVERV